MVFFNAVAWMLQKRLRVCDRKRGGVGYKLAGKCHGSGEYFFASRKYLVVKALNIWRVGGDRGAC